MPVRLAASAMPSSWWSRRAGFPHDRRRPRSAERRVLLTFQRGEGDRLVGAGVQGADDDVLTLTERLEHRRVDVGLLLDARFLLPVEEAQLGAEQADALDGLGDGFPGRLAVGDVGEQLDRCAVLGAARPGPGGQGGALLAVGGDAAVGLVGVRLGLDGAGRAVDEQRRAVGDLERSRGPDHAGNAELAGDDRGMAGRSALLGDQGVHDVGVEPRGVGGCEVLGDEHAGCGGQRHARLGLADEVGDHSAFDVAQVGGALGHQPAHAGEDCDELLHRRVHGRDDRGARGQVLLRRGPEALVAGQARTRGQHLGGGTTRLGGLVGEPVGDGRRRGVIGCQRGVDVGEPAVAEALHGGRVDLAANPEGGGVCDTRDDGRAHESDLRVRHERIQLLRLLDSQHIRA